MGSQGSFMKGCANTALVNSPSSLLLKPHPIAVSPHDEAGSTLIGRQI